MVAKLMSIYDMKFKPIIPLLFIALTSCSAKVSGDRVFCFNCWTNIKLFDGNDTEFEDIKNILKYYDKISDNYSARGTTNNLYQLNKATEVIEVDSKLYDLLHVASEPNISGLGGNYFDYRLGSLSKLWKDSLAEKKILDEEIVENEIIKMQNSALTFGEENKVLKVGQAEIDLGGIVKGYTLDVIKEYLTEKERKSYIIDSGSSSILLGEKQTESGYFNVTINDLDNSYIKVKNGFVSTSGTSRQGVRIGDVTCSHIVNPVTGSVVNNYDAVIVLSDKGYIGDVLSTSMMMATVDEIKDSEQKDNVKVIVIKDKNVIYKSEGIEILHY